MFETVRNAFKIKDLRKKLFYTFFALIVVRIGSQLPVPGVKYEAIREMFNSQKSLDFFNQLTGGSFESMSIFALNITPYITASIIIQLLTIAIPRLEELHKDGEEKETHRIYKVCDNRTFSNGKCCHGYRLW